MIVNISEKPVISVDTGRVGALKGLIYENNKVISLYCKFSDKYIYVPVTSALFGPDAIMIGLTEDKKFFPTDVAMKVYTESGKEVGSVSSIETDDSFNISGITVNNLFIDIDKILHMNDIITVTIDEIETDNSVISLANQTPYMDEEDDQTSLINSELNLETSPASLEQVFDHTVEIKLDPIDIDAESTSDIDPRYNYLVGKKLLEDISIVKETYKKGTLIDVSLVEFAINNNAIIKVIMNTED